MSDRSARDRAKFLPGDGQVAHFVFLHPDTALQKAPHSYLPNTWIYQVEGKPRPMLVLQVLTERERGRVWFLAVPVTTKGTDGAGNLRRGYLRIGNCLERDKESFVRLEMHKIPDNRLHVFARCSPVMQPCDKQTFLNAVQIIRNKAQRGELPFGS